MDPLEKGLPVNLDAERFVLGAIILDDALYSQARTLPVEAFSLEKHRKIFRRMQDMHERGECIDRVTIASELMKFGELEACDGMGYLASLDDGLPAKPKIDSYLHLIKEAYALRRLVLLGQRVIHTSCMQQDKPEKIIRSLSHTLTRMEMSLDQRKTSLTAKDVIEEHGGMQGFISHAIKPGISTGFPQWDEVTLGLQESCHYIVGGKTGSGKTAIVENIGVNVARSKHPVVFFSVEMSKEILLARAFCGMAEVPFKRYILGDLMPEERSRIKHAIEELSELPFYVDDTPDLTINELGARWDRAVAEHGARLVIVDYLQILSADRQDNLRTEYDRVTAGSKICRMKARQHKNSSIALSQLTRPADKKRQHDRPTISDLKASGGIENDAAAVALIWREEMGKPGDPNCRGKAECIFPKSRVGGMKTIHLEFQGRYYKFIDNGPPETITEESE